MTTHLSSTLIDAKSVAHDTYLETKLGSRFLLYVTVFYFIVGLVAAAAWVWLGAPPVIVGIGYTAIFVTVAVTWFWHSKASSRRRQ